MRLDEIHLGDLGRPALATLEFLALELDRLERRAFGGDHHVQPLRVEGHGARGRAWGRSSTWSSASRRRRSARRGRRSRRGRRLGGGGRWRRRPLLLLRLEDQAPDECHGHAKDHGEKEALVRIFHFGTRSGSGRTRAGGTGSGPPGAQGWQRSRRRAASQAPRRGPWTVMASTAYSEQLGWYRQAGGRAGETRRR